MKVKLIIESENINQNIKCDEFIILTGIGGQCQMMTNMKDPEEMLLLLMPINEYLAQRLNIPLDDEEDNLVTLKN